jgi:RNA polymerase sigma factor (sigma-70 family)
VSSDNPRAANATEPATDFAQLTSRMAQNDEAAFRQFYELYFNRLLRYLLVLTSGREDAAREALQATLLRVVRHIRRFDSEAVLWSWLTVLARSSVVDAERKRSRYAALLDRFFRSAPPVSAEDADADGRLLVLLEKNFAGLDQPDRELLERKYFAGDSVREIAREAGMTEKAVESRLVRVRRQLKAAMLHELKHEK